jgi:hypothetical protein
MSGDILDPLVALNMWADHPKFAETHRLIHPSLDAWAVSVAASASDAILCMSTLVALVRRCELLLASDNVEEWRNALLRIGAVAEVCGRTVDVRTFGPVTACRFVVREVAA